VRQGSFPSKVTASYESDPSEWPALRPEDADAVFKAVLPWAVPGVPEGVPQKRPLLLGF